MADVARLTCPKCGGHAMLLHKDGGQILTCAACNTVVTFTTDPVKIS